MTPRPKIEGAQSGLPPVSPLVYQFGAGDAVFTLTVRFNESNHLLQNMRLDRSDAASQYSAITINGAAVGQITPGGTLTVSGPALAAMGLETIEDIGSVGLA